MSAEVRKKGQGLHSKTRPLAFLVPLAIALGIALLWCASATAQAWRYQYRYGGHGYQRYYRYSAYHHRRSIKRSTYRKRRRHKRHHRAAQTIRKRKRKASQRAGIGAKAVYCVNLAGNRTLLAKNADRPLPIASLTKLVTALVVLDHMPFNRVVRVPRTITRVPKSVVGLKPGDRVSVKDLLHGMLMQSGNDCAETLARAYPGGRTKFIRAMNRKARKLGTKKTRFYTPSGLDLKLVRKFKSRRKGKVRTRVSIKSNISTAREIALIAQTAFSRTIIKKISRKRSYVMSSRKRARGYRLKNTNKLLKANLPILSGKTGYTSRAGKCFASEFNPGRNKLVIVVLGSRNHFRDTRLVYRKALKKVSKRRFKHRARHSQRVVRAAYYGS